MVARLVAVGLILMLVGCQTTGGSFCSVARPIRLTKEVIATLTDTQVASILAHNRKGQKLCGWKP